MRSVLLFCEAAYLPDFCIFSPVFSTSLPAPRQVLHPESAAKLHAMTSTRTIIFFILIRPPSGLVEVLQGTNTSSNTNLGPSHEMVKSVNLPAGHSQNPW